MKKNLTLLIVALAFFQSCSPKQHSAISETVKQDVKIDSNLVVPPAWAFGILYGGYTNQQLTIQHVADIKKHNYPIHLCCKEEVVVYFFFNSSMKSDY